MFTTCNFGVLVMIWIVQIIIYPSFRVWEKSRFQHYYSWYFKTFAFIAAPLMCWQFGMALYLTYVNKETLYYIQLGCIVISWLVTIFISVPLHQLLQRNFDVNLINRLITTNWLRTISWSLVSAIGGARILLH